MKHFNKKNVINIIKQLSKLLVCLLLLIGLIYSLEINNLNLTGVILGIIILWFIQDFYSRSLKEEKDGINKF